MDFSKHRVERNKNLFRSLKTGIFARFSGLLLQVISLPIAAASLGVEDFSVYSMISAILAWATLSNLGISQATTLHVAKSLSREKQVEILSYSLSFITITVSVFIMVAFFICYWTPFLSFLFSSHISSLSDVYSSLVFMGVVFILTQYLSVIEAGQLAAQRQANYNIAVSLGTSFSAIAVYFLSQNSVTVFEVLVAVHSPVLFARVVNAARFFNYFSSEVKKISFFSMSKSENLIKDGLSFLSGGTISNFICHPLSIILVGIYASSLETASLSAVMNAVIIVSSVFGLLVSPLRGAIPEAYARGDSYWVKRSFFFVVAAAVLYSMIPLILFAFYGELIFDLWYQGSVKPHELLLTGAGLYIFSLSLEVVMYNFLANVGQLKLASRVLLIKSMITGATVWYLSFISEIEHVFISMFTINIIVSLLPLIYFSLILTKKPIVNECPTYEKK